MPENQAMRSQVSRGNVKRRFSRSRQIAGIADALNKSQVTIRHWIAEGMDIYNPESVIAFYQAKNIRRRNRTPRPGSAAFRAMTEN
jgi:hypothetical protein